MAHHFIGLPPTHDTAARTAAGLIALTRATLAAARTAMTDPDALLTAIDNVEDIAHRLSVDTDDALLERACKPFSVDELTAALEAAAPDLVALVRADARIAP